MYEDITLKDINFEDNSDEDMEELDNVTASEDQNDDFEEEEERHSNESSK